MDWHDEKSSVTHKLQLSVVRPNHIPRSIRNSDLKSKPQHQG